MSADFDTAVDVVLRHEGGWVNDPADPGGATNYGISLRWLKTITPDADESTIRNMHVEYARDLYRRYWWEPNNYSAIVDQNTATKIFDMAVNMGAAQAHRLTQRALLACGHHVAVDGFLGPQSMSAINQCATTQLLGKLVAVQSDFYRLIAAQHPSQEKFLPGWLHRAAWPLGAQGAAA